MKLTTIRIAAALLLATAAGIALAAEQGRVIGMYVGEIRILRIDPVQRVAVGNGDLLSTSMLQNGQLLLLAEDEGTTTVHVWFEKGGEADYTVEVSAAYVHKDARLVSEILRDIDNLEVRVVGEHIVLYGAIPAAAEPVVTKVMEKFPQVMNLTTLAQPVLTQDRMVLMNVKITEFNKNSLRNLGIDWDNQIAGPAAGYAVDLASNSVFRPNPKTPLSNTDVPLDLTSNIGNFGIVTEISSRINLLVNSGDALILAEPRLVARSGGEATFLAGGEVPLPTTGALGQSNVEFKEFGISMTIRPVVDGNERIQATVETEISAIDNSVAVDGIPGFLTRKTGTDISMQAGETLVMSGLISQEAAKDRNKLALLGDIPILGELFKSRNFRNRTTELVIFVTPTVYDAQDAGNQAAIQRQAERLSGFGERIGEEKLQIIE